MYDPVPGSQVKPRFQWTIARKIGGLSAILILFILLLLSYSVITLTDLKREIREMAELNMPLTELSNKIEFYQLKRMSSLEELTWAASGALSIDHDALQALVGKLDVETDAMLQQTSAAIQLSELGLTTTHREAFQRIWQALTELRVMLISEQLQTRARAQALVSGALPDVLDDQQLLNENDEVFAKVDSLVRSVELFTSRNLVMLEDHERIFLRITTALGTSGALLGIVISAIVILGIRTNVFRLTEKVTEATRAIHEQKTIATGNSPEVTSSDEVGVLAARLNELLSGMSKDFQKRDEASRQLLQVATTDPLTGAFNRLKLEEDLDNAVNMAVRAGAPLSIILFDIDFFKKVNDTHGHDVGDRLLENLVRLVHENVRQVDTLYRIGGEEFLVLTRNTARDQAVVLAEKLRRLVEMHEFEGVGRVTISIGCAQLDESSENPARLFKKADEALYRAKAGGRNQVCTSGAQPPEASDYAQA